MLFVNVPGFALTSWKWIRPIVPQKHLDRIEFLDNLDHLLEIIGSESLHELYGGEWKIDENSWIDDTIKKLETIKKQYF